jgi:predicted nucleic acid-binding protein
MAKEPVLVDTWAIIALSNSRDAMHERATEISRRVGCLILCASFV